MSASYEVRVVEVETADTVPDRISEQGLVELLEAFGGTLGDEEDIYAALHRVWAPLTEQQLGEKLLDLILLQPPIPAGCEALVAQMKHGQPPPWVDHEVAADRFWLWYAHHTLSRALPEVYGAPEIRRVKVEATMRDASARPPGKRTAPRDRTRFVARLLADRPGDNPISAAFGDDHADEWAFDVVWHAEVQGRRKPDLAELDAIGVSTEDAESGRMAAVTLAAWVAPQWVGDLAFDQRWTSTIDAPRS